MTNVGCNLNREFLEMVFSVQTNFLLKQAVKNVDKYQRKRFISLLKVDIQNVKPIYFNGQKYSSKSHKDNFFLYLDRDFKIIGILKGSSWDKEWEILENYSVKRNWHNEYSKAVIKNRSNMEKLATHIIMITPDMQSEFRRINKVKPLPRFIDRTVAYRSLDKRLHNYKLNKHRELTPEQVIDKTKELIVFFTNSLFDKEQEKILVSKRLSSRSSFIDSVSKLIRDVTTLAEDYWNSCNELSKHNAWGNKWAEERMSSNKIELVNYFKTYLND